MSSNRKRRRDCFEIYNRLDDVFGRGYSAQELIKRFKPTSHILNDIIECSLDPYLHEVYSTILERGVKLLKLKNGEHVDLLYPTSTTMEIDTMKIEEPVIRRFIDNVVENAFDPIEMFKEAHVGAFTRTGEVEKYMSHEELLHMEKNIDNFKKGAYAPLCSFFRRGVEMLVSYGFVVVCYTTDPKRNNDVMGTSVYGTTPSLLQEESPEQLLLPYIPDHFVVVRCPERGETYAFTDGTKCEYHEYQRPSIQGHLMSPLATLLNSFKFKKAFELLYMKTAAGSSNKTCIIENDEYAQAVNAKYNPKGGLDVNVERLLQASLIKSGIDSKTIQTQATNVSDHMGVGYATTRRERMAKARRDMEEEMLLGKTVKDYNQYKSSKEYPMASKTLTKEEIDTIIDAHDIDKMMIPDGFKLVASSLSPKFSMENFTKHKDSFEAECEAALMGAVRSRDSQNSTPNVDAKRGTGRKPETGNMPFFLKQYRRRLYTYQEFFLYRVLKIYMDITGIELEPIDLYASEKNVLDVVNERAFMSSAKTQHRIYRATRIPHIHINLDKLDRMDPECGFGALSEITDSTSRRMKRIKEKRKKN